MKKRMDVNHNSCKTMEKENLTQSIDQQREEEMANGIFRAYNLNKRLLKAKLTFQEKSLHAVTIDPVMGLQNEENNIPYSSIKSVIVQSHGVGKYVEIKTASETFKFNLFNTEAFVDFFNEKTNIIIK